MEDYVLTFLGSESGFGEKNTSAYFEIENKIWLIDCGFTVFNEVRNCLDLNKYEEVNVIITHLHNDHARIFRTINTIFMVWIWKESKYI